MSPWLRIAWLSCAAVLLAPRPALAAVTNAEAHMLLVNTAGSWYPGDRIRVVSPEPYRLGTVGWFSSLDGDSAIRIQVAHDETPLRIGLYEIGALEQKVGTKRHVLAGALVGAAIGALLGFATAPSEDPEVEVPYIGAVRMKGMRQSYIVSGTMSGLVLGGIVGFCIKTDRFAVVAKFD